MPAKSNTIPTAFSWLLFPFSQEYHNVYPPHCGITTVHTVIPQSLCSCQSLP